MSAWPVLVPGETLQISPIVTPGFGADFDGDAMNYHVPVSDDAVREAIEKMMPSKNLFNVDKFDVHYLPRQEYLHGLYLATRKAKANKLPRRFASREEAIKAYSRGEINADDPVIVGE
jgi:DNA-directed RNA polymerase subunit beta'